MITKEMTETEDVKAISSRELKSLNPALVPARCRSLAANCRSLAVIGQALTELGAFGEVRIVKSKNRVRFIKIVESRDMLKIASG